MSAAEASPVPTSSESLTTRRLYTVRVEHVMDGRTVAGQVQLGLGVFVQKLLKLADISLDGLSADELHRAQGALIKLCPGGKKVIVEPHVAEAHSDRCVPATIYKEGTVGFMDCTLGIDGIPFVNVNRVMQEFRRVGFASAVVRHHVDILRGRNGKT